MIAPGWLLFLIAVMAILVILVLVGHPVRIN